MLVLNYTYCINIDNVYWGNCICIICNYSLHFPHVVSEHVNSIVPSCVDRTNVNPSLGEQLDLSTPRHNNSNLQRSMMNILSTETSDIILLLYLWHRKVKVFIEFVNLYMVISLFGATNGIMRKTKTIWVYELDCYYGKYLMAV